MAEYENPADKLRRDDEDRQRRLAELGEAYDDLLVTVHRYGKAHSAARDGGWQAKQLKDVGFVEPNLLKVPAAPARLLAEREAHSEGASGHDSFGS